MIPFVSPATGAPLRRDASRYVSASGESFPVVDGIPRFVPSEGYADHFGLQWRRHARTQLDSHTGLPISRNRLEATLGAPLSTLRGLDVLEAGCGAGRFTELLVEVGARVHSIDLSTAVEANLQNLGERPDFVLAQADLLRPPFPAESFDVVFCLGVVQHTPSSEETIARLYAMVKPGGRLVFDHYAPTRWWRRPLLPLYRAILKHLSTGAAQKATDALTWAFFPLHWALRERRVGQVLLSRLSPVAFYYAHWPQLPRDVHFDFSALDTHDVLTDFYKHRRTPAQIRAVLEGLGAEEVFAGEGWNGVDARCRKPARPAGAGA